MAATTICTELPAMRIFRGMTGIAIRRRAFVFSIHVTGDACDSTVTACQRETSLCTMVKVDILPVARVMTLSTVTPHLPGVNILMAGGAIRRRALEQGIFVAVRTCDGDMFPQQLERSRGVIEFHFLPGRGGVTGFAVLAQRAFMRIIRFMAGGTIHGRTFEEIVHVTALARHVDMTRQQFENGTVVIEMNDLPTIGGMTGSAIRAQLPLMSILRSMARGAILRGSFEIR